MTKKQLIEGARKALEEFNRLPDEEQWRQMMAWGIINEKGEVLWNGRTHENEEPVGQADNDQAPKP